MLTVGVASGARLSSAATSMPEDFNASTIFATANGLVTERKLRRKEAYRATLRAEPAPPVTPGAPANVV